jgi:beta-lactamase regulating signal transducer with metallopeptidase domain
MLWVAYLFSTSLIAIYTTVSPAYSIPFLRISPHKVKENIILLNLLFPQQEAVSMVNKYTSEYSMNLQEEIKLASYSLHWSFWIMCGWITGIILSLLYTLTGRIGVTYIFKNASKHKEPQLIKEVSQLAQDLGITRELKVIVSCRCRLPFTYNFVYPVLVAPYEAIDWPESKRRTIFIHELSHIRRNDYLILSLSHFICSVFWYLPVMWIAHTYLQVEQEKLCDHVVIQKGEQPTAYAKYMVDSAHTARGLILWSAIFFKKKMNMMLESRVNNLLGMKQQLLNKRTSIVKNGFIPVLIFIFAILIAAGNFSTEQEESAMGEVQFGTWVNTDYNLKGQFAKTIINSDGTIKRFNTETDTEPICHGKYAVKNSWHDRKGNTWIKFDYNTTGGMAFHVLSKYSNSGTVWEWVDSEIDYPTEMSPIAGNYSIYYRKK